AWVGVLGSSPDVGGWGRGLAEGEMSLTLKSRQFCFSSHVDSQEPHSKWFVFQYLPFLIDKRR
ncbi:hypothetical protein, partial [Rhizobium binae]|uniref:hypothetical protein n=1 Tax=Rhizobium binae TaxID=1138190 RepID=UPI001C83F972